MEVLPDRDDPRNWWRRVSSAVWKYQFPLTHERQVFNMPHGAIILDAQMRGTEVAIWALVHPGRPMESRFFQVFGTGDSTVPDSAIWIGTTQQGVWVWHVFEVPGD